ncbi:MAG: hypothetical protein CMH98_04585 [Oceanospirillaceae bacterium]|nr:hypothetical protein [Oceanospirillaceae bacterium]
MVSQNLIKAVKASDIDLVKAIILREINSSRTEQNFKVLESCTYAKRELEKSSLTLFEEDNGKTCFSEDKNSWDKDLWQDMRIDFQHNFSENKINNIVRVMQHLRIQGHSDFQVKRASSASHNEAPKRKKLESPQEQRSSMKSTHQAGKNLLVSAVIGSSSGVVAGLLTNKMIGFTLGGFLGGLVVGAVVNKVNNSINKD